MQRDEGRMGWQNDGKATGSHTYLPGSFRPGGQRRAGRNQLLDPVSESRGEISSSTARDAGLCV